MTLYLDTSSLVKLYVDESGTHEVRALVAASSIVATSVLAYAETRAALARRRREGALTAAAFTRIKRDFERDWPKFFAIAASEPICREAGALAERYRLRGFDSLHLASCLEVARHAGASDIRFSSCDDRLNRAARLALHVLAKKKI